MTLYIDSSAYLKLYLEEPESDACQDLMIEDPDWVAGRHTSVEVRRNLARHVPAAEFPQARSQFERDWARTVVVELDARTCELAGELAERTGARTLDALHLAAAERARGRDAAFLTYDRRQADAARRLGWAVVGL